MKRILVTGASGFIGSSLISLLLKKGFLVRATSRTRPQIDITNSRNGYEWVPADLISMNTCKKLMDNISCVFHLAAKVHVMADRSGKLDESYKLLNTEATRFLAKEAANNGVERFVFMSTVKVNGKKNRIIDQGISVKFTSSDVPRPTDAYAASKYEAELQIKKICTGTAMESVIIRPPLVYGPGVGANFLRMMKMVELGIPMPLKLISNSRSLIYRENLSHILFTCMNHPNAAGKTYLVRDVDISTPDLIRALAEAYGCSARLFPFPVSLLKKFGYVTGLRSMVDRLTDPLLVDDCEIRNDLLWDPPYRFQEGLNATVKWYRELG